MFLTTRTFAAEKLKLKLKIQNIQLQIDSVLHGCFHHISAHSSVTVISFEEAVPLITN